MSPKVRLAILEGLSLSATICAMLALWSQPTAESTEDLWAIVPRALLILLICIFSFYYHDLYDFEIVRTLSESSVRLIQALGASALGLAIIYLLLPDLVIVQGVTVPILLMTLGLILGLRAVFYGLARSQPFSERVLILGTGPLARRLAEQIGARPDLLLTVAGFLSDNGQPSKPPGPPVLGAYSELDQVVFRVRPHRILLALPERRGQLPVEKLVRWRFQGVVVEDGVTAYERFAQQLAVESLAPSPSALILYGGLKQSALRQGVQRGLSLLVAATGMVLTVPLMTLVGLLIKLDSPGPVFFIQPRIGQGGRPFRLMKFRTMRKGQGKGDSAWQRDNTGRLTRVGRVLRRYRLDELPQFFNILKGDMNLVGPRPEMVENAERFCEAIPFYPLRHTVRPGLTGWAQIRHPYSMSLDEVTKKLCYDLYYIKHMSLWFDLRILFDTAKVVLLGRGAQ